MGKSAIQSRARASAPARASRRRFLKTAGAGAGLAALSATGAAPFVFVRPAAAADKELRIIQWSHFVPAYDKWFDQFVRDWGSLMAAALIASVPFAVLYNLFLDRFIMGITGGAVK